MPQRQSRAPACPHTTPMRSRSLPGYRESDGATCAGSRAKCCDTFGPTSVSSSRSYPCCSHAWRDINRLTADRVPSTKTRFGQCQSLDTILSPRHYPTRYGVVPLTGYPIWHGLALRRARRIARRRSQRLVRSMSPRACRLRCMQACAGTKPPHACCQCDGRVSTQPTTTALETSRNLNVFSFLCFSKSPRRLAPASIVRDLDRR
jgi:hypothetical protein